MYIFKQREKYWEKDKDSKIIAYLDREKNRRRERLRKIIRKLQI